MAPPMTIDPSLPRKQRWESIDGGSWRIADHSNLGEARSTLRIFEIPTCAPELQRRKHVTWSDNRVTVGAVGKGRPPSPGLNKILQKLASLQLGTGTMALLTWVWTKTNPADNLSRDVRLREFLARQHAW